MEGMRIFQTYHTPGTLAANQAPVFKAPCDLTLVSVQGVASNASSATLKVGTTSADAAYLAAFAIGQSGAPVEKAARGDFAGGQFPNIPRGTLVQITLDYDGASGTAAQNVTYVLTYLEG